MIFLAGVIVGILIGIFIIIDLALIWGKEDKKGE